MQDTSGPPQINSWLEEELLSQYNADKKSVDSDWASVFSGANGTPSGENGARPYASAPALEAPVARIAQPFPDQRPPQPEAPPVTILEGDQVTPLRGPALRIAENMSASLSTPAPTSQRSI